MVRSGDIFQRQAIGWESLTTMSEDLLSSKSEVRKVTWYIIVLDSTFIMYMNDIIYLYNIYNWYGCRCKCAMHLNIESTYIIYMYIFMYRYYIYYILMLYIYVIYIYVYPIGEALGHPQTASSFRRAWQHRSAWWNDRPKHLRCAFSLLAVRSFTVRKVPRLLKP